MYQFTGKIGQFYKFNANCSKEEKTGTGPGSCGGKKDNGNISDSEITKLQNDILSLASKEKDPSKLSELRSKYLSLEEDRKRIRIENKPANKEIKSKQKIFNRNKNDIPSSFSPTNSNIILNKFSDNSLKLVDKLGDRYKTALRIYVNGSVQLNSKLRSSKHPAEFVESSEINDRDTIARLTKLFSKSKSPSDITVYRGISIDEWDSIPKEIGETFESKSFTSTTHNDKVAKGFSKFYNDSDNNSIIMEIRIKKGIPAFSMDSFVQREYPNSSWMVGEDGKERTGGKQNEIILNRNQQYKVINVERSGNHKKVILETI